MASATLIGDVVRSRDVEDRAQLHATVRDALTEVNAQFGPITPLRITVGDEYQGVFGTVGQAARAAIRMRLVLLPDFDVRHGLGWGEVHLLDQEPRVEDGPGWWAAREAIEATEVAAEHRGGGRGRRTSFRAAPDALVGLIGPGDPGEYAAWIESTLVLVDQLVNQLSERSLSVLRGLLAGKTQREIAGLEGISPSAVSQRVRTDGLASIVTVYDLLEGAR